MSEGNGNGHTSLIETLRQAATQEVEAGGYFWRIRKVNSRLLVNAGTAALALVPPAEPEPAEAAPETEGPGAMLRQLERIGSRAIDAMLEQRAAVVAAGVVAISGDGETWEAVRVLCGLRPEPLPAGAIHVDQLPPGAEEALFGFVFALSTDGGAAATRLAAFRAGTADAPPA